MMPLPYLWRPCRDDLSPLLAIVLLPLIVALPAICGVFHADPLVYNADVVVNRRLGWLPGVPYIDPNGGFQTQALGHLAIEQWRQGIVPWWNSYSGVGMPLAAEYQSAVFSPLTLFLLLPNGMTWQHLSLQIISGLGCFALFRQLGLVRLASLTGALLFAENGTIAWFNHGPAFPAVFLPLVLLGIERAAIKAVGGLPHGWRLLSVSSGLMLLAGFPETAYICGVFTSVWAVYRLIKIPTCYRFGVMWRLALGGGAGLALAAPQVVSFLEFLPIAFIDSHKDVFAHTFLPPLDVITGYFMPYALGPIFAYGPAFVTNTWNNIGGYVDGFELAVAAAFVFSKRDFFCWTLIGWLALSTCKNFGIQPLADWWNYFPGVSEMAFFRYSAPSSEFAIITLVALSVDMLAQQNIRKRAFIVVISLVSILMFALVLLFRVKFFTNETTAAALSWMFLSTVWAVTIILICLVVLAWMPQKWHANSIAALLILDATMMFTIPTFSNPQSGTVDTAAIEFLKTNLGLQRFYTLGPIAPNYSAYFKIASVDYNYLPLPLLWADWASNHLDTEIDPYIFNGTFHPNQSVPSPTIELQRNLLAYEEVGVKYIVTQAGLNTLPQPKPPKVYSDPLMDIYELPEPKPYFEALGGDCMLEAQSRTSLVTKCNRATTLVRRELFFPGWHARIDLRDTPINERDGLFEAINLPAGQSKITFFYTPPHIIWAWQLMTLATLTLVGSFFIPRQKNTNHG